MGTEEENRQIAIVLNFLVAGKELNAWMKKPLNFKGKKIN